MAKKIRLSLDVTPTMDGIIKTLADNAGTSKGEVLRRAIALYKAAKEAEAKGCAIRAIGRGNEPDYTLVGF